MKNTTQIPLQQYVGIIEAQRRLRIPSGAKYLPPWLVPASCPIAVRSRVGRHDQVILIPNALDSISPELIGNHANEHVLDAEPGDHDLSDLLRLVAAYEEVSIGYEPAARRYTMVLPKELERLGLIPEIGSSVVILAIGESLELWKTNAWVRFRAANSNRVVQFLGNLNDDLA